MFSTAPVTRLSIATTSSPRSSSARQRCEPRNPAPPVTTTRAMVGIVSDRFDACAVRRPERATVRRRRWAADAVVAEPGGADGARVEQVARVDDHRAGRHQRGDLVEVDLGELRPLGGDHEHVAPARRLGGTCRRVRCRPALRLRPVGVGLDGRVEGLHVAPPASRLLTIVRLGESRRSSVPALNVSPSTPTSAPVGRGPGRLRPPCAPCRPCGAAAPR